MAFSGLYQFFFVFFGLLAVGSFLVFYLARSVKVKKSAIIVIFTVCFASGVVQAVFYFDLLNSGLLSILSMNLIALVIILDGAIHFCGNCEKINFGKKEKCKVCHTKF